MDDRRWLLILLFLVLLSSPAYALTYGNLEVKLIKDITDYPAQIRGYMSYLPVYTPQCLGDCHMPLLFRWNGADMNLLKSGLSYLKDRIAGLDAVQNIRINYLDNETYYDNITDYVNYNCKIKDVLGSVREVCDWNITGYHLIPGWRLVWKNVPETIPIKSGKWYAIDIIGYINPSLKPSSVDIIPKINDLSISDYAWWNSSWTACKNLTVQNTLALAKTNEILVKNITGLTFANYYELRLVNASCSNGGSVQTWKRVSNTSSSVEIMFNKSTSSSATDIWSVYYNNPSATNGENGVYTLWDNFTTNTLSTQWKNFTWSQYVFEYSNNIFITTSGQTGSWVSGIYNNTTSTFPTIPFTIYGRVNITTTEAGLGLFNSTETATSHGRTGIIINGASYYAFYCNNKGQNCASDSANIGGTTNVWYRFKIYFPNSTGSEMDIFLDSTNANLIHKSYAGKENITNQGMYFGSQSPAESQRFDYAGAFAGDVNFYNVSSAMTLGTEETSGTTVNVNLTINGGVGNMTTTYYANSSNSFVAYASNPLFPITISRNGTVMTTGTGSTNISAVLGAGFYNISSYSNGTSIATIWMTINKQNTSCDLLLLPASPLTFPYPVTALCMCGGQDDLTYLPTNLWRNGVNRNSTENYAETVIEAGTHNYTCNATGNANYSTNTSSDSMVMNQADNPLGLTLYNGTTFNYPFQNTVFTYPMAWKVTATGLYAKLYRANCSSNPCNYIDVTAAENNTYVTLPANQPDPDVWRWTYLVNSSGNQNYSANTSMNRSDTIIYQGIPAIDITFNTSDSVIQGTPVLVTCNKPSEISISLYNDTGVTTNPLLVNTTGLNGLYNYTCNTTGNDNYTTATYNKSLTVAAAGSLIISSARDENNVTKTLTFNVQIYNATYSTSSSGITTYNNNEVKGSITVVISSTGYGTRRYYLNVSPVGTSTMIAYLLNESDGHDVTIYARDFIEFPIEGAAVDILRLISSNWTTIAQGSTDASGLFVFLLDPNQDYKINIYASGYNAINTTLIPALTSYTFHLSTGESVIPSYWDYYKDLTGSCSFSNTTRNLTCPWSDASGHLNNVSLVVTRRNSTTAWTWCSNASTSSSGTFTCSFGAANNNSFVWSLRGYTSSEAATLMLASGSWTDLLVVSLGLTGIFMSFLIVLTCGFIGVQVQSPLMTVMMTLVGVGVSFLFGLVDFGGTMLSFFIGLMISGAMLMYKLR